MASYIISIFKYPVSKKKAYSAIIEYICLSVSVGQVCKVIQIFCFYWFLFVYSQLPREILWKVFLYDCFFFLALWFSFCCIYLKLLLNTNLFCLWVNTFILFNTFYLKVNIFSVNICMVYLFLSFYCQLFCIPAVLELSWITLSWSFLRYKLDSLCF